jgi:hypothetical protein
MPWTRLDGLALRQENAARVAAMAPFGRMRWARLDGARAGANGLARRGNPAWAGAMAPFGQLPPGWLGEAQKSTDIAAVPREVAARFGQIGRGSFGGGAGWRGAATGMPARRPPKRAHAVPPWPARGGAWSCRRLAMAILARKQEH